jgi:hypothetical protein
MTFAEEEIVEELYLLGNNVVQSLESQPTFGGTYRIHFQGLRWIDLRVIGCGYMDWIHLADSRVQWRAVLCMVIKLRVL